MTNLAFVKKTIIEKGVSIVDMDWKVLAEYGVDWVKVLKWKRKRDRKLQTK